MIYHRLRDAVPRPLRRYVQHFERAIEDSVAAFAASLQPGARVLDAGAGEGNYKHHFAKHSYIGLDLGIGDAAWNYARLDVIANLENLPFPDGSFDACINIVTLEHVIQPQRVLCEIARTLRPGGALLLVAPLEWEEHQQPHDYFRYTRYGLELLLKRAGFSRISIVPTGGIFRLISRRLLNALQFFPGPLILPAAIFLVPPALVLPLFDGLDRQRAFTPGFICTAVAEFAKS
ncbi:MAG TPA: class I SAM-dependent methyltransferase [Bryobacteraceae bacterium]|nr:class I SAM-dependent methyltransferase [Bryobacteraceae bacterium]